MSKYQRFLLNLPIAIGVLVVVGVGLIILWLVLQRMPSSNLSASIPRMPYRMDKWDCPIQCECVTLNEKMELTTLGEASGLVEICTNKILNKVDYNPFDPLDETLYAIFDESGEGMRGNNCDAVCGQAYPGIEGLIGGAQVARSCDLNESVQEGSCWLDLPREPISPKTSIVPSPSTGFRASPSPIRRR